MNYNPKEETKWLPSDGTLPTPNVGCPNPGCQGFIEDNTFKSKKGKEYQSVKCSTCGTKWIIGDYPSREKKPTQGKQQTTEQTAEEARTLEGIIKIYKDLSDIKEDISAIREDLLKKIWEKDRKIEELKPRPKEAEEFDKAIGEE